MLQRSKLSNKLSNRLLIGLMGLGFVGAIVTTAQPGDTAPTDNSTNLGAPAANSDSLTRNGVEPSATERTPDANYTSPERSSINNQTSDQRSGQTSSVGSEGYMAQVDIRHDLPVNDTRPGGNERESASRTPRVDPGESEFSPGTQTATSGNSSNTSLRNSSDNTGRSTYGTSSSSSTSTPVNGVQSSATERDSALRTPLTNNAGNTNAGNSTGNSVGNRAGNSAGRSMSGNSSGMSSSESPSSTSTPVNGVQPGATERDGAVRTPVTNGDQSLNNRDQSLVQVVGENASFNTLAAAVKAAGLEDTLSSGGPYTLFAPTDAAFAALPPEVLNGLLQPQNQQLLRQILAYHVVQGNLTSAQIQPGSVNTVEGSSVAISTGTGQVTVGDATVIQPEIITRNGVIHPIDRVLLPPSLQR